MEMSAILWALKNYGDRFPSPIVYSDSAYCVNSFTVWIYGWKANGWKKAGNKKLENLDLILQYDELTSQGYKIDLIKCDGHVGITMNEYADDLATGRLAAATLKERYNNEII